MRRRLSPCSPAGAQVLEFTAAWKAKVEGTRDVMIRDQAALNLLMREGFHSKVAAPAATSASSTPAWPLPPASVSGWTSEWVPPGAPNGLAWTNRR